MGFPTAHLSKDFAHSSGPVAAGFVVEKTIEQQHKETQDALADFVVEKTVEQQHKETQEREMDRANLTGAGEFAARGSINVAGAKLEAEKKKKDSEKMLLQSALEQQRQQMLDQLNNRIGKLTKEIERDQLKLEAMRNKRSGLDDLGKLVDAGKITPETPHNDVLDRAGIQDKKTFINSDKGKQKDFVQEEIAKLDPQINELVEKIDANMNKLEVLADAKEKLENGADPKLIAKELQDKGIKLEVEASDDPANTAENTIYAIEDKVFTVTDNNDELTENLNKLNADQNLRNSLGLG